MKYPVDIILEIWSQSIGLRANKQTHNENIAETWNKVKKFKKF